MLGFFCAPIMLLGGILTIQMGLHAAIRARIEATGRASSLDQMHQGGMQDDVLRSPGMKVGNLREATAPVSSGARKRRHGRDEMLEDTFVFFAGTSKADLHTDTSALWDAALKDALPVAERVCNKDASKDIVRAWPMPAQVRGGDGVASRLSSKVRIVIRGAHMATLNASAADILRGLSPAQEAACSGGTFELVLVEVLAGGERPEVTTENEGYDITVWPGGAWIVGATVWGALHALKTLAQMVESDDAGCLHVPRTDIVVNDRPRFSHRGFLLDTAHRKIPVGELERIIYFASAAKLNVFHWHLTDHQSWGVDLPGAERLASGCPDGSCYTQANPPPANPST